MHKQIILQIIDMRHFTSTKSYNHGNNRKINMEDIGYISNIIDFMCFKFLDISGVYVRQQFRKYIYILRKIHLSRASTTGLMYSPSVQNMEEKGNMTLKQI